MTENFIQLPIGTMDADEFISLMQEAINETLKLIFERRALDLHEDQTYALYFLTNFQSKLQSIPACTTSTTIPTSTSAS